ncbi:MAG: hypothetical protein PHQ35_06240 [Phycisphaerae bacterium]|nr:hypothetical protein [Phycisphaerae bacterium]
MTDKAVPGPVPIEIRLAPNCWKIEKHFVKANIPILVTQKPDTEKSADNMPQTTISLPYQQAYKAIQ